MTMPSLARFSLAALLGLGLLSACSSPPSPQYPDIRFNGAPAMKLDASAIEEIASLADELQAAA